MGRWFKMYAWDVPRNPSVERRPDLAESAHLDGEDSVVMTTYEAPSEVEVEVEVDGKSRPWAVSSSSTR